MNFHPNLIKSSKFKSSLNNLELEFHQTLAKKLLNNNNKLPKNLQHSVFSYIQKMKPKELIKICSINSKWLIDIIHQLILFSKLDSQLIKFEYDESNENEYENICKLMEITNLNKKQNDNKEDITKFTNYFQTTESKFICLSKKNNDKNPGKILIQSLRYLTINLNNENKKEFNNILTLSYDFLLNFETFKEIFLKISKEECFKNPIKINQNMDNNNNKIKYNFELPEWILKKEIFTVGELICAYFEQIILLHFQYDNIYHTKIIPFPFQNKLDEIIENSKRIINFIDNISDKNKFFSELDFNCIKDIILNDKNINEEIEKRSESDKNFSFYFENNIKFKQRIKTIKEQIDIAQFKLHKFFFDNYIIFVEMLFFTNDDIAGTIEDFVNKKIFEQIYNLYCQKITNELINNNVLEEENIKKKKKRKHKKKKNKKKEEKKNEECIIDNNLNKNDLFVNEVKDIDLHLNNNNKDNLKDNLNDNIEKNNINDNKNILTNNINLNEEKNNNTINNIIISKTKLKKEKKEKPFFLFPVTKPKKNDNKNNSDSEKNKNNEIKNLKEDLNILNKNIQVNKNNSPSFLSKTKTFYLNNNSPIINRKNKFSNILYKNNYDFQYNNFINHKKNYYENSIFNLLNIKSIENFSKEILENTKKVNYNKELLFKFREKLMEKIILIITSILNENKNKFSMSKFGSYISGLSIENSDIDLMIKLYDNSNICDIISIIIKELNTEENKKLFSKINPIYTASVPVIKLECELNIDENIKNYFLNYYSYNINEIINLKFDISFFKIDEKNKNIKIPSELILDFIKENINLYPCIIDIIYIMKRYLQNEKLNLSYKGGISSFSLFLLILSFIKSNKNKLQMPIGSLLIEFLIFYSNLNFGNYIINPKKDNKNEIFEELFELNNNYLIHIKDPFSGLNVSKSSFKVLEIQFSFSKAAKYIINSIYINYYSGKNLYESQILTGLIK